MKIWLEQAKYAFNCIYIKFIPTISIISLGDATNDDTYTTTNPSGNETSIENRKRPLFCNGT